MSDTAEQKVLPAPNSDAALQEWGKEWKEKYHQDVDSLDLGLLGDLFRKKLQVTRPDSEDVYVMTVVGASVDCVLIPREGEDPEEVFRFSFITDEGVQVPVLAGVTVEVMDE